MGLWDDLNAEYLDEMIGSVLESYADEVMNAVNQTTDQAAKELRSAIAKDAPLKTGKQKKSWKIAKKREGYETVAIIHSTDYRKVHLLENGHLTRDGVTRTKALNYVGKNADKVLSEFPDRIAEAVRAVS